MKAIDWVLITIGMLLGMFTPWQYQVPAMAIILMVYAACYSLKWDRFQRVLAFLFGGVSIGLGLQVLIGYGIKNQVIPMIIAPLLTWLVLRVIFYAVETKYTLHPNLVLANMRAEENGTIQQGTSAWVGDNNGMACIPDADGRYMRYEFYVGGEICMGGPTDGDAIFNNQCAFSGVGPSIGLSADGQYAAMTQPSRNKWGLLIINLHEKRAFQPEASGFWEIDRIEDGTIYGRESPLTSNTAYSLSIARALETATEIAMTEDDGWWVMDYPGREPFAQYKAVTIASKKGAHRITFVPDLKPFQKNPFLRNSHPEYTVLVDDELLNLGVTIKNPSAMWVDGHTDEKVNDGRFLVVANKIIDFKDSIQDAFSIKNFTVMPFLKGFDESTNTDFEYGEKQDAGDAHLLAHGTVLSRSTGWTGAEFTVSGDTSPWDEESVVYWGGDGKKQTQDRKAIVRQVDYKIDLVKLSYVKELKLCTSIYLVNRGNPRYQASLVYQGEENSHGGYSSYKLITSYGAVIESVIQEAIWSSCGRYLAVVHFEHPPSVPKRISIIDYETGVIKRIAGIYALPSFIWFDKDKLQFTHVVGIVETIDIRTSDPREPYEHETVSRIAEPEHVDKEYELLIARKLDLERNQEKERNANPGKLEKYSQTTIAKLAQHCILFAPDFDAAVLQPPKEA